MIKETKLVHSTPYLKLYDRTYINDGKEHSWHVVSRKDEPINLEDKNNENAIDAVHIVATMVDNDVERLVVVREYRPPVGGWTLGLPAGLVDKGETAEEAAIRELKEETGLEFTPTSVSPQLFNSPGMTDESCVMVFGNASGKISEEFQEEKENISTSLLTKDDLLSMMAQGQHYDAKSWFVFAEFINK